MVNTLQFNGLKMGKYGTYHNNLDAKGRKKVNRRIGPNKSVAESHG